MNYKILAEEPGVARGKGKKLNVFLNQFFLAYSTPRSPMRVQNNSQPIQSSRLAGYREHLYE